MRCTCLGSPGSARAGVVAEVPRSGGGGEVARSTRRIRRSRQVPNAHGRPITPSRPGVRLAVGFRHGPSHLSPESYLSGASLPTRLPSHAYHAGMATQAPERLWFSGDPEADRLLVDEPLALLIGFVLDQQVPL